MAGEGDVALEHLSGALIKEFAYHDQHCETTDIEDITGCDPETLNNEIGDIEVRCLGQVLGEQSGRGLRIVDDLSHDGCCTGGKGGDEEYLDDLESHVPVLGSKFDFWKGDGSSEFCHCPTNDGHQGHENGKKDGRKQTSDDPENLRWDFVDES